MESKRDRVGRCQARLTTKLLGMLKLNVLFWSGSQIESPSAKWENHSKNKTQEANRK